MPTARVARRVLALALAASLLPLALTQAHHSPTVENVLLRASELVMTCESFGTEWRCQGPDTFYFREPGATIRPLAGPLASIDSEVNAHSNGIHDFLVEDRGWMTTLHATGCADTESEATEVRAFMDTVAATLEESSGGSVGPTAVAECTMTGTLFQEAPTAPWRWRITSVVTAGAFPTPVPTPPPTPRPTPVPTPPPTPTPTPSTTPSPSLEPSATESESEQPSPEGSVGGIVFTPEPSAAAPDTAPAAGGNWTSSVPGPAQVSTEPAALVSSALLAFLLLLFMGFVGELFNNTAKANYDVMAGWWADSRLGRSLRRFTDFWKSP